MKGRIQFHLLVFATLMSPTALPGYAQTPQKVTVSMRAYKDPRSVVAVKINGAGPYDFLVDTGATTTVVEAGLFRELGLQAEGTSKVVSELGASRQARSVVKEITLDGLSVENVAVVSMKSPLADRDCHLVRGILAENFLRHFDILFDNQHRTITLDAGQSLSGSLSGERLPVSFPPIREDHDDRYQPTILVKLQAYGNAKLLLDSGTTSLVLVRTTLESLGQEDSITLKTVNASLTCKEAELAVHLGKATMKDVQVVACQTAFALRKDRDGTLPTALFKQIFISHAGSYAIINPIHVPEETANLVTPAMQ
jgi:predicted aspartyl protease